MGVVLMDEHVDWLVAAVQAGAKRHDQYEIERHFAVTTAEALELGARLHEIASRGRNASVVVVERAGDGRLRMPTFR
jgi:hypothetical protein